MSSNPVEIECSNSECKIKEGGDCLEELALEECPYIVGNVSYDEKNEDELDSSDVADDVSSTETITLPAGQCLKIDEASAVLRSNKSRVLAVIGPTKSGKTSLIASLFELFQIRSVKGYTFARSKTLIAFEQACHDSRAASLLNEPDMKHTPHNTFPGGVSFYHIGLRVDNDEEVIDLLFADRTGEDYRSVSDDPKNASEFHEVKRADSITMLIDGERLLNVGDRHNLQSEALMILQGLVDGNILSGEQNLNIALTKLDSIKKANKMNRQRCIDDFEGLVQKVIELFGTRFAKICQFELAASPKSGVLEYGYGVNELLQAWMHKPIPNELVNKLKEEPRRAFGRFQYE